MSGEDFHYIKNKTSDKLAQIISRLQNKEISQDNNSSTGPQTETNFSYKNDQPTRPTQKTFSPIKYSSARNSMEKNIMQVIHDESTKTDKFPICSRDSSIQKTSDNKNNNTSDRLTDSSKITKESIGQEGRRSIVAPIENVDYSYRLSDVVTFGNRILDEYQKNFQLGNSACELSNREDQNLQDEKYPETASSTTDNLYEDIKDPKVSSDDELNKPKIPTEKRPKLNLDKISANKKGKESKLNNKSSFKKSQLNMKDNSEISLDKDQIFQLYSELENLTCFHGEITREKAEEALNKKKCFLIRKKESNNSHILSTRLDNNYLHVILKIDEKGIHGIDTNYRNFKELVYYFTKVGIITKDKKRMKFVEIKRARK